MRADWTLCTIVTPDHLDRALALRASLQAIGIEPVFVVLTTAPMDRRVDDATIIELARLAEVDARAQTLASRYVSTADQLRWCLKPVLISHLLRSTASRVIYCDADMCFFGDPAPLLAPLGSSGVVLTPHWRPSLPLVSERSFCLNFLDGLYNAGCVAADRSGLPAMDWWISACLFACERDHARGLYDDQRYLDLMPVYFSQTTLCRHQGFNVADWNMHLRAAGPDGSRPVPDTWPISLVHFTTSTVAGIRAGRDASLTPFLAEYERLLEACRYQLETERGEPAI